MKTLTQDQKQELEVITEQKKAEFLEVNKNVYFDIEAVRSRSVKIKEQFDALNLHNAKIKLAKHEQLLADAEKLRVFFGENADAIVISESGTEYFEIVIGATEGKKLLITYRYADRGSFSDYEDRYTNIEGRKYEKYYEYDIEFYHPDFDTEYYQTLEAGFNDADVIKFFEFALLDYLVYHKKESEEILTE